MYSKVPNKNAVRLLVFSEFSHNYMLFVYCLTVSKYTHTIINFHDFPHLHGYLDSTLIRYLSTLTSPWVPTTNSKFLIILKYYFAHLLSYRCLFFGWIWLKVMIRILVNCNELKAINTFYRAEKRKANLLKAFV